MSDYRTVPLTQGKFALVDQQDFGRVTEFKWYAGRYKNACGDLIYYAQRRNRSGTGPKTIMLHRFILNAPGGLQVDHIDRRSRLDCRRGNLRLATTAQNAANRGKQSNKTSCFKGASWHKGKWESQIKVGGRSLYLGRFSTEEDAARAYNTAATLHFGEFARLNIVPQAP